MTVKTWLKVVIGATQLGLAWVHTASLHTVPPLCAAFGTEKKYFDKGVEAIPAIVVQGVRPLLPLGGWS